MEEWEGERDDGRFYISVVAISSFTIVVLFLVCGLLFEGNGRSWRGKRAWGGGGGGVEEGTKPRV